MVNDRVYQTPINNREDMEHRIEWEELSATALTHAKKVVDSILNISLADFVIKTSFSLVFHSLIWVFYDFNAQNDKLLYMLAMFT